MHRIALRIAAWLVMPAAATVVFAATAAAQSIGPFMVFFDRGSAVITPQGQAILDNAADAYRQSENTQQQVMIAGHTDLAVAGAHGVTESQKRANNVRDYLISRGIPAGVITTEAFGSTRPLVETPAGVLEPQNRRVEITFGPGSGW